VRRRKMPRNSTSTPEPKKSAEDLVGNEENEYPLPDPNRMMLIMTNGPND
jgi:hypothetical protein